MGAYAFRWGFLNPLRGGMASDARVQAKRRFEGATAANQRSPAHGAKPTLREESGAGKTIIMKIFVRPDSVDKGSAT